MSYVAMPYPVATMPPMSGEMSMAPMITATLFMLRPTEAIKIAMIKITRFAPFTVESASIRAAISSTGALSRLISNTSRHSPMSIIPSSIRISYETSTVLLLTIIQKISKLG